MDSEKFTKSGEILKAVNYWDKEKQKPHSLEVKLLNEGEFVPSKQQGFQDQILFQVIESGIKKRLYLNKSQMQILEDAWGKDTMNWIGKDLRLEPEEKLKPDKSKYVAWNLIPIVSEAKELKPKTN